MTLFFVPAGAPDLASSATQVPEDIGDAGPPDTPLSEQLRLRARRGGAAAADSVASLARIGRWNDVDVILTELAGRPTSEENLVEMGHRMDPAVMIRIRSSDQLSETSLAMIRRISVAAKNAKESSDRLRQAIKNLGASSRDKQIGGLRDLRGGGRTAIQELVRALVAKEAVAPREELTVALMSFGPGGLESLRQLALYGHPEPRSKALEALAATRREPLIVEWVTALHAADSTDAERNLAANQLVQLGVSAAGGPPVPRDIALQTLRDDLQRKRRAAREFELHDTVETMWSLNEGRDGVVYQDVPAVLKAYRDASDASARLRRVGITLAATTYQALNSDLGYRVMVDADWGDADQVRSIRDAYPSLRTPEGLSSAIDHGLVGGDTASLVGLLRMVSTVPSSASDRLRHDPSSQTSPLVRAVDHADARVRFEAAAAIATIDGSNHYAGSSRVRKTLGEMRSLGQRPIALLLETVPDVIVRQEGLLSRLGYQVIVVGSAAELQRAGGRRG